MPSNNDTKPPALAAGSKSALVAAITGRLFWPLVVLMMIIPWPVFYFIFFSVWRDIASGKNTLSGTAVQRDIRLAQNKLDDYIKHAKELNLFSPTDLEKFT